MYLIKNLNNKPLKNKTHVSSINKKAYLQKEWSINAFLKSKLFFLRVKSIYLWTSLPPGVSVFNHPAIYFYTYIAICSCNQKKKNNDVTNCVSLCISMQESEYHIMRVREEKGRKHSQGRKLFPDFSPNCIIFESIPLNFYPYLTFFQFFQILQ